MIQTQYSGFASETTITHLPYHQQIAFYYAVATREISRHLQTENAFRTSYEQIVDQPFETFHNICNFLSIPWNDSIIQAIRERTETTRTDTTHGTFRRKTDNHSFTKILTAKEDKDIRGVFKDFQLDLPLIPAKQFTGGTWKKEALSTVKRLFWA
jgi:hypothetical protein